MRRDQVLAPDFLARRWAAFREQVMADVTHPVQIQEMRLAFFAGARAVQSGHVRLGGDDITEDEGVEWMRRVEFELREFLEAVGRA